MIALAATGTAAPLRYTPETLRREGAEFLQIAASSSNLEVVRERLLRRVTRYQFDVFDESNLPEVRNIVRVRDCTRAMRSILRSQSDKMAGFSVTQALVDLAHGTPRPELGPGFFAELLHMIMGMQGRGPGAAPPAVDLNGSLSGQAAARVRSQALDDIWHQVDSWMGRYPHGLLPAVIEGRRARTLVLQSALGATAGDWYSWRWQLRHVIRDRQSLEKVVTLSDTERANIDAALAARLPFGVTPYYLSLMDDCGDADRALRAQVFPPESYVEAMCRARDKRECAFDFMLEHNTSPIELVTRRYPGIVILKPYNSCPQICVYCQRNWEIEEAMAPRAMASDDQLARALSWIGERPAIHEVLVTGGDPLAMGSKRLGALLDQLARIDTVDHVRLGSRTPVTLPMRFDDDLIKVLADHHQVGRQDLSLVTHVQHPYEITPDLAAAVRHLRRVGINVYNQQVFTFYSSRRYESALLRRLLRKIGIEPYYTFNTKGKGETYQYRVPIARLLQEIREEARLLPGLSRTDEAVYNVPGLGKNYLRAWNHRDLVSITPEGARIYEFHPWDRNLVQQNNYIGTDVPILDYLSRLEAIGEDPSQYQTIWYYY